MTNKFPEILVNITTDELSKDENSMHFSRHLANDSESSQYQNSQEQSENSNSINDAINLAPGEGSQKH